MLAFEDMMRKQIVMPAHLMDDNQHKAKTGRNLFKDFSTVAEYTETYTAYDYANIMEHLVSRWGVADLTGVPLLLPTWAAVLWCACTLTLRRTRSGALSGRSRVRRAHSLSPASALSHLLKSYLS